MKALKMNNFSDRISKCLLNPPWKIGTFSVDNISFGAFQLLHPDFGEITIILSNSQLEQLYIGLGQTIQNLLDKKEGTHATLQ